MNEFLLIIKLKANDFEQRYYNVSFLFSFHLLQLSYQDTYNNGKTAEIGERNNRRQCGLFKVLRF